ncbi:hypothetical protein AB0E06_38865 [Streptomyces sp. NPDC048109]|uniref:hypothetical protein n=1 Tax=Streptomyces sp. NPDC048109 TaxID=3155482 RepID=UPI00341F8FC2
MSEPERGVIAASAPTAAAGLVCAFLGQVSEPAKRAGATNLVEHTRLISPALATGTDGVLAVASHKLFGEPDSPESDGSWDRSIWICGGAVISGMVYDAPRAVASIIIADLITGAARGGGEGAPNSRACRAAVKNG